MRRLPFVFAICIIASFASPASGAWSGRVPRWTVSIRHAPSDQTLLHGQEALVSPRGTRVFVVGVATGPQGHLDPHPFVVALATDSGRQLWRRELPADVVGFALSPNGGRLYALVARTHLPRLFAIRSDDGIVAWSIRLAGTRWGAASLAVGPTGTVFVATWIRRAGSRESLISLSARRPADGTRRWHATYGRGAYGVDPGPLGVSPDGSTLVLGATVNATSSDGCPRAAGAAFDTSTGAERWHALGPVIPGCGQVSDVDVTGRVAIFTRYGTYGAHGGETYDVTVVTAREISDGSLRWRRSFRYLFLGKTEIGPNGRRAIVAGEWQGRVGQGLVLSLEVATGATLWRRGLPMDVWAATFAPSATRVYVTGEAYPADLESTRGVVRALDAEDGAGRWRASYRDPELPNAGWVDVSCSPRGSAVFVIGDSNDGTPGWASGIVGHVLVASYRA